MVNEQEKLMSIYNSLRGDFIVIGLTGALGSGCSKTAEILGREDFPRLFCDNPVDCVKWIDSECKSGKITFDHLEIFRAKRLIRFYKGMNAWESFRVIKISYILEALFIYIYNNVFSLFEEELKKQIEDQSEREKALENLRNFIEMSKAILENGDKKSKVNTFIEAVKNYKTFRNKTAIEEILKEGIISSDKCLENEEKRSFLFHRSRVLQELGRFLRRLGNKIIDFEIEPVFWLAELVRRCIKILSEYKDGKFVKGRFVIDALRNPFEIEYFRNRYSNFYLFSILAIKDVRKRRLKEKILLSDEEIKQLQGIENKAPSSKEELYEQNINFCVGKGDVFINNDDVSITLLTYQLGKYIALILNPGLVTPTKDEIFMQVAFTARYASGCISRQVGAVVTGKDGYVRGVGWNDVPEKQIPCLYRTLEELKDTSEITRDYVFSDYELSSDFKDFALNEFEYNRKKWNKNFPFCFKDIQNQKEVNEKIKEAKKRIGTMSLGVKGVEELKKIIDDFKNFKNPTRERALHAEENAFLQAAKVGGMSVAGGTLYSTDSPCQLCAKKSRQLFIKRIVYIDDYPDISKEHTLCSGKEETRPKIEMFSGAIGQAYFKLYAPFIPRKDELKLIL